MLPREQVDVTLRHALTGDVLGTIKRKLPHVVRIDELSRAVGEPFQGYAAAVKSKAVSLDGLVIDHSMVRNSAIELPLVRLPTVLENSRLAFPREQRGLRRWYKEFRAFAQRARLSSPNMPSVVRDGPYAFFYSVDLRDLAPLILQAVANESRERHSQNLPHWFRTFEGCEHALVRRTGAALPIVHEFVDNFCEVNADVLALIDTAVQREPHRNFFN